MTKQVMSENSGTASYRITIDQGIEFYNGSKKNTVVENSLTRYKAIFDNLKSFLKAKYPQIVYFDETQKIDSLGLDFREYRLGLGRASKTVSDEEMVLSSLYKLLIKKNKIVHKNPFSELDPLMVEPRQLRRVIPKEELNKFFNTAKEQGKEIYWYGIFMVFYATGMRRDELRFMEKSWVNFETNHFEIPSTKTMKGKVISKAIPIHPDLKPILEEAIARSNSKYLFPNKDGTVQHKNKFRVNMKRISRLAGIPEGTPHDFRHTFSTMSRLGGMSNEARRTIGGWSNDEVMNSTYTHYPEDKIQAEYFKLDILSFKVT